MLIEDTIFKRSKVIFEKLIPYGFIKQDDHYLFTKPIQDTFQMMVTISLDGSILGKIIDLSFQEEYINYRLENQTGEFVNYIRNEFMNTLLDIKEKCFCSEYFISDQANRITSFILNKYGDVPQFLWENAPNYGVFKNPNNHKWYGIIMNINQNKLDNKNKEVELLNIKLAEDKIIELLKRKGFYKAYHMNKTKWITIILDDTLEDHEIIEFIKESHSYTVK